MNQASIVVRDGTGYLSGVPSDILQELRQETSYRPAGFQFSPKYNRWVGSGSARRRAWDGRVYLIKHSKFPAGLLGRVIDAMDERNIPYDLTPEIYPERPTIDVEAIGIDQRDYQDSAVEAALLNRRGVIRVPTGGGKTPIAARIIAAHACPALVIVPTIDLLHQTRTFLDEHLSVDIGQLGDGIVNPREVTVATVRTVANSLGVAYESYDFAEYDDKDDTAVNPRDLREWVERIGTLIVDEAHILGAEVVYSVANKIAAPNKYGMSASPWRDDGADLKIEAATGKVIYRVKTKELVDNGYLVPPVISVVDTKGWWTAAAWGSGDFGKAYKQEIVENQVRNAKIAEIVNDLAMPTLCLVKQINHGRVMESMIDDSVFLSGKDSGERRTEVYDDLRGGRLKVVIATTIADLGLDLPVCQALVLCGGGKASTRHLQRIGRVARPYPGKKSALVVDFNDAHVHKWFRQHERARRKIEREEWAETAIWI